MADTVNEATDFLNSVVEMAKRIGIPDDKMDAYVHEHMTGAGYQMVPTYVKPEGNGENKGGFSWGGSKRSEGGDKPKSGSWFA